MGECLLETYYLVKYEVTENARGSFEPKLVFKIVQL